MQETLGYDGGGDLVSRTFAHGGAEVARYYIGDDLTLVDKGTSRIGYAHIRLGDRRLASFWAATAGGTGNGMIYYHRDRRADVVATTAGGGTMGLSYRYLPSGQIDKIVDANGNTVILGSEQQAVASELGFIGGIKLSGGLLHLKTRVYSPAIRRFLQPDTLDARRYTYAGGDGLNFRDPSGRDPQEDINTEQLKHCKTETCIDGPALPPQPPPGGGGQQGDTPNQPADVGQAGQVTTVPLIPPTIPIEMTDPEDIDQSQPGRLGASQSNSAPNSPDGGMLLAGGIASEPGWRKIAQSLVEAVESGAEKGIQIGNGPAKRATDLVRNLGKGTEDSWFKMVTKNNGGVEVHWFEERISGMRYQIKVVINLAKGQARILPEQITTFVIDTLGTMTSIFVIPDSGAVMKELTPQDCKHDGCSL